MNNEIVASAVASFNNAALAFPNFIWSAVLMLPVFFVIWKMAPEVLATFFSAKKNRVYNFAWMIEALLVVWLIFDHGNWDVMRDGAGVLPYLIALILFLLCRDVTARLREQNPRVPLAWRTVDRKTKKWVKINALLLFIYAVGAAAAQGYNMEALQISATLFGVASGFFGRKSAAPVRFTTIIIFLVLVALTMQPEYFRFGQLGHLSLAHLFVLIAMMKIVAVVVVFLGAKPSGFIKDNHYKYTKWFMWLACLLAFILFVMTESVPVLLGFGLGIMITTYLAIKHLPKTSSTVGIAENMWVILVVLLGVAINIPAITVIGILCWKNNAPKNFIRSVAKILL